MRIKKFNEGWSDEPESELYYIVRENLDRLRDGKPLNKKQKEEINSYFEYPGLYDKLEVWLKNKFEIFSRYDIEDVEDRLVEFFDEIHYWEPHVMFSLHLKYSGGEGWLGITSDRIGEPKYLLYEMSHVLSDLLFHRAKTRFSGPTMTIDEFLKNKRACISIHFNRTNESRESYNLLFLEDLMDRIVTRLSKLYNITQVMYDYNRYTGRLYDPDTDVNDYTLSLIIE